MYLKMPRPSITAKTSVGVVITRTQPEKASLKKIQI